MRHLKKLSAKLFFLLIPFVALNVIYINSGYLKIKYDMGKFDSVPENLQVANLGSSHGYIAFDYSIEEFKDKSCFNFALQQQTLDFDSAIFKQYINNFRENSLLIICLSPFETNGTPNYETDVNSKLRYYDFLKPRYFGNFSLREWFSYKYLSLFSSPHPIKETVNILDNIRRNAFQKNKSDFYFPTADLPAEVMGASYADVPPAEKEIQASKLVKHWVNTMPPSRKGMESNFNYIDTILELCKARKIKTAVITTPISREVFNALDQEKAYYPLAAFMDELSSKYPKTLFLNYTDLYFDAPFLLGDNNHLNRTGAKNFSKTLYKDLQDAGFLE